MSKIFLYKTLKIKIKNEKLKFKNKMILIFNF